MKLTDILREIEGEEDGMQQVKVRYDLAVEPADLDKALAALNDTKNYGIYAQNMRDQKVINRVFGPSIDAQKKKVATGDWDSRSEDEKVIKLIDIKNRVPEAWDTGGKEAEVGYEEWQAEGNDGTLEDYLVTLPFEKLPKSLLGPYSRNYFPKKTAENQRKYGGKMEQDIHYVVKDGKIIFPSTLENPYKTKPYLSKVLKTIMDTAGVDFKLVDVEQDVEAPKTVEKPKAETVAPLSYTADNLDKAEKARAAFQKEIGDVPTAKYEIEPIKADGETKYKLVVTGISADQRAKLFTKKTTLKEEQDFDLERYQMLRRAGIIK
jgi:hypothetical protein